MLLRILLRQLILPPALNIVMLLLAVVLWRRWPRSAIVLASSSILGLWLCSTPYMSEILAHSLEDYAPPLDWRTVAHQPKTAIVILGSGLLKNVPEYEAVAGVSGSTLYRVRYGAWLQRHTGLPVLVSGGRLPGMPATEADIMGGILQDEFNVSVTWLENESHTTEENARYSSAMLHAAGIEHVVVVTSAWHMQRSVAEFQQYALDVIPAPTAFMQPADAISPIMAWVPMAATLSNSAAFIREYVGMLVYGQEWRAPLPPAANK